MPGTDPWWQTFFDESYIEAWAAQGAFDSTDENVRQLVELLELPRGARVLDVPCGFGRFSRPLHEAGLQVTGVDISDDQIRRARRDHAGPDYHVGDMREPPPGPYDAVLNLFSSFGYFTSTDDDVRCLQAWYDALRPGGQLVLEMMHRDRMAWSFDPEGEPYSDIETGSTDWATGVRTSVVRIGDETREFRLRLYTATELLAMVEGVGFVDARAHGDLTGAPLDPSTRLVVHAFRPGHG